MVHLHGVERIAREQLAASFLNVTSKLKTSMPYESFANRVGRADLTVGVGIALR